MKNKKILIALVLIIVTVVAIPVTVILIKDYQRKQLIPSDRYIVGGEIRENTGETFTAIIHKRTSLDDGKNSEAFSYELTPASVGKPQFASDHPFLGYNCGTIDFGFSVENDTMIINEIQEKMCNEEQWYYITTLITETRDFSKIRVNQFIDDELINFYEYEIPERMEEEPQS